MAVINSGMRKAIKIMCVTAQTAQFISLMPKPKDFATRLVGDVVYLSSVVMKLSEDVNKLLDMYANIPTDYIMNQINSITGSATRIVDRVSTYAQNAVNQGMGVASNTMELLSGSTIDIIDAVKSTSNAVVSLGGTVAHTSSTIIGKTDVASDIQSGVEEILMWNGDKFEKIKESSTKPIYDIVQKVNDANNKIDEKISEVTNDIKNVANKPQEFIEDIISKLKESMDKLSSDFDNAFPLNIASKGMSKVTDALKDSGANDPASQAAVAVLSATGDIFKNFSISKVIRAFGGVLIQAGIVEIGLDKLPPIDFERMLLNIRGEIEDNFELSKQTYLELASEILNKDVKNLDELSEELKNSIILKNGQYTAKAYNEYKKNFNKDIREKRKERLQDLKKERDDLMKSKKEVEKENDTAIIEQRKLRKEIKEAKQTDKFKDVLKKELENAKDEFKYRSDSMISDWNNMMKRYEDAIKEIKGFFQNGGDGDMFIDDCCDRINQDCDDIKELCKNLTVQLTSSTIKVAIPSDLGPVFPNPIYKIADLWMDIKIILKFIKDLITLIIDIINHIYKLARIMLNGLNNLKDIVNQLMELLGIKWFMDLVQNIIDLFGDKITNIRELLENMLSPVYYKDTYEYESSMETIESLVDDSGNIIKSLSGLNGDNRYYQISDMSIYKLNKKDDDVTEYEKLINELEEKGDDIVAYKSPILDYVEDQTSVDDIINDGKSLGGDVRFMGWHFFHTTMRSEYKGGWLFNKIKNRIISKASKTGNKANGGVKGLNSRWKVKGKSAYNAFYWYTYYTLDLEKDCFVGMDALQDKIYIDNIMKEQNGSVVEINDNGVTRKVFVKDNMVRKGDYVNVDGKKYRVQ